MVEIIKEQFKLRPFYDSDALPMSIGLGSKAVSDNMTIDAPWSTEKASWWISFITDAAKQKPVPEIHFVVEIEGQFAGSVGVINIDGHKGEMGYWLVDKFAGKGVMTQAIAEVVKYCHKELKLERIFAPVLTHNKASERVLERNGFTLEGTLRKYYFKNGQYVDAYCYAWTN